MLFERQWWLVVAKAGGGRSPLQTCLPVNSLFCGNLQGNWHFLGPIDRLKAWENRRFWRFSAEIPWEIIRKCVSR
jgi:hypothetical protein